MSCGRNVGCGVSGESAEQMGDIIKRSEWATCVRRFARVLTEDNQLDVMLALVRRIPHHARVVAGILVGDCARVYCLVLGLWVDDQRGDVSRPWRRLAVFEPAEINTNALL